MSWQEPVFDRTAEDVAAGVYKCYFSPELLNRIEENTRCLAELFGVAISTRTWQATDFLTPSQMQRILDNIRAVEGAYHPLPGTPSLPALPATLWSDVNAIEQRLWGIKALWDRNQQSRIYAGEISVGEQIGVI